MKIKIELNERELSEILIALSGNSALHLKILSAVMSGGMEGYENKTGFGPAIIPYNWTDSSAPYLGTVLDSVKAGKKIQAIKIVRANTGLGLKETKDILDSIMN